MDTQIRPQQRPDRSRSLSRASEQSAHTDPEFRTPNLPEHSQTHMNLGKYQQKTSFLDKLTNQKN